MGVVSSPCRVGRPPPTALHAASPGGGRRPGPPPCSRSPRAPPPSERPGPTRAARNRPLCLHRGAGKNHALIDHPQAPLLLPRHWRMLPLCSTRRGSAALAPSRPGLLQSFPAADDGADPAAQLRRRADRPAKELVAAIRYTYGRRGQGVHKRRDPAKQTRARHPKLEFKLTSRRRHSLTAWASLPGTRG